MTMRHENTTIRSSGDRPHGALTSYFRQHRFALYLIGGVGFGGILLSGGSLAVTKLLPLLVFLPCIAMMFMCMKHGSQKSNGPTAEPIKMQPPQPGKSLDPQQ